MEINGLILGMIICISILVGWFLGSLDRKQSIKDIKR